MCHSSLHTNTSEYRSILVGLSKDVYKHLLLLMICLYEKQDWNFLKLIPRENWEMIWITFVSPFESSFKFWIVFLIILWIKFWIFWIAFESSFESSFESFASMFALSFASFLNHYSIPFESHFESSFGSTFESFCFIFVSFTRYLNHLIIIS